MIDYIVFVFNFIFLYVIKFNFYVGFKCLLVGCIRMELSSYGEYCDFNDEKEFVNVFGGVVYDYDSMLKVVVVYILLLEKLNK